MPYNLRKGGQISRKGSGIATLIRKDTGGKEREERGRVEKPPIVKTPLLIFSRNRRSRG